jgi:hypothetical protein
MKKQGPVRPVERMPMRERQAKPGAHWKKLGNT